MKEKQNENRKRTLIGYLDSPEKSAENHIHPAIILKEIRL